MKWIIAAVVFAILAFGSVLVVLWTNDVLDDFSFRISSSSDEDEKLTAANPVEATRVPSLSDPSLGFWVQAKPIIDRQLAEVGQPLTELIILIDRELCGEALSVWYEALLKSAPLLNDSYVALLDLNAPIGRANHWQHAQLSAWGKRLDSIGVLAANWSDVDAHSCGRLIGLGDMQAMTTKELLDRIRTNAVEAKGGFTGSPKDFQLMSDLWDQSMLAGREADRLQRDLVLWLSSDAATVQYARNLLETSGYLSQVGSYIEDLEGEILVSLTQVSLRGSPIDEAVVLLENQLERIQAQRLSFDRINVPPPYQTLRDLVITLFESTEQSSTVAYEALEGLSSSAISQGQWRQKFEEDQIAAVESLDAARDVLDRTSTEYDRLADQLEAQLNALRGSS